MKILKWFGIVIVIIIALLLIIPLFLPSSFHIERSTDIEKHVNVVFQTATDMNQRAEWDPWIEMDSEAIVEVTMLPEIIGSGYTWKGDIIGEGKITIEEFIPNELIKSKIEFIAPQSMKSDIIWTFQESDHNTIVTWAFEGTLSYPIEKWFGLFMDKSLGSQFEKGLSNFKSLVEKQPDLTGRTGKIEETNFEGLHAIAIKEECPDKKIIDKMLKTFFVLRKHLKANSMEITNPPFVIYHASEKENHTIIECAIPINGKIVELDNMKIIELPASKTIMATHFGHYNTVKTTSDALQVYIQENNIEVTGSRFEIYITDPMKEPDSRKWETKVYYPIK
jgi:effector-binding domain-containing protein